MAGAKDFAAVNTKISGLSKNLLTNKDYQQILSMSQPEILDFLKKKEFIESTDFQELDYLSVHLKRVLIQKMRAMGYFLGNRYKTLMDLIIDRYEIDDVKKAIRNIYNKNMDISKDSFVIRPDFFKKVVEKGNVIDFIDSLSEESYYSYLRNYKEIEDEKLLFYLEMSLDRFHYSDIFKFCEKLDKGSRKKAKELFGTIIDLKNLVWIYRAKKFYNVQDTLIYNYSIFRGLKFGPEELLKLSRMDLDSFVDSIFKTDYGFLFSGNKNTDLYMSLEMDRFLYDRFYDYLRGNGFNIGKVLGYILIYEFQIKDIMVIMQGKEFKMEEETLEGYLIGNGERRLK
ncbi:V-type ATPase subunit [Lagierella sp.]|uniref:V-type ATPase subunit n=1 Tax=Lagierella sp. TaxID=2849657 RepID=UPI0026227C77|nr:V-type ATPase subunit [Lagierella sp.]